MRGTGFYVAVGVTLLALSSMACAEDRKADATLELTQTSFAILIGYTWGDGTLTYQDKKHSVAVEGVSVLALGVVQATASGEVFNLSKLEDFNGTYIAASVEGTLGAGAGAATMRNEKGVIIHLFTSTQGLNLKIAPEGMRLSIK